jgi:multiple sugar transport system ATP-binding protein
MVILRAGSKEITARYEPVDAPAVGELAELLVDMSKACLFDPATEERL